MTLPSPPSGTEKWSYLVTHRFWFYGLGFVSASPLVIGMLWFSFLCPYYWYLPFAILFVVYLGISLLIGFLGKDFDPQEHFLKDEKFRGTVDVYVPTCGEDIKIIDNTLKYAAAIEYEPKEVYVLDDSGRESVRMLANKYGANYLSRPDRPRMKKAGNLRYAFQRTNGEFILVLDADFAARHDILHEIVPYFKDQTIAIVQTPQFFSVHDKMNWVEAGAGYVQELFYRLIQVSRDTFGAAICVGSCAVYRREALKPFGGTAEIGYSEDLHTGFNVLNAGWRLKYLPIPMAKGVCPNRASSFFSQQYRWCMGSFTLFLNPEFWKSKLSVMQKICYLSGMLYYVATAISVFITPVPVLFLLYVMPEKIHWLSSVFAIPSFLYGTLAIGVWTQAPIGWSYFLIRAIQPWAHLFAISDRVIGSAIEWIPTNSRGVFSRFKIYINLSTSWYAGITGLFIAGVVVIKNNDYGWMPSAALFLFHVGVAMATVFKAEENDIQT